MNKIIYHYENIDKFWGKYILSSPKFKRIEELIEWDRKKNVSNI